MSAHSTKHTLAYKAIDDVDLTLDLYLPDETKFGHVAALTQQILAQARGGGGAPQAVDGRLPVLIFWHGGCLVVGTKDWTPKWLLNDALDAGFAVVCPNYTLLKPYTGHDILADLKDLHNWVNTELNTALAALGGSQLVDVERVAVAGASAGGMLAYLSAVHAEPKPLAVASIYGMAGDLLSDFYVHQKTKPWLCDGPFEGYPRKLEPLYANGDKWQSVEANTARVLDVNESNMSEPRLDYACWLYQDARYLDVYTGLDGLGAKLGGLPYDERAAAIPEEHRPLFSQLVPVTEHSSPLFLIHGTEDTLVSADESRAVKRRYDAVAGATCELVEVPAQEHSWEIGYEQSKDGLEKVVPFLVKHTMKK